MTSFRETKTHMPVDYASTVVRRGFSVQNWSVKMLSETKSVWMEWKPRVSPDPHAFLRLILLECHWRDMCWQLYLQYIDGCIKLKPILWMDHHKPDYSNWIYEFTWLVSLRSPKQEMMVQFILVILIFRLMIFLFCSDSRARIITKNGTFSYQHINSGRQNIFRVLTTILTIYNKICNTRHSFEFRR